MYACSYGCTAPYKVLLHGSRMSSTRWVQAEQHALRYVTVGGGMGGKERGRGSLVSKANKEVKMKVGKKRSGRPLCHQ